MTRFTALALLSLLLISACTPQPTAQESYLVSLVADGRERTFNVTRPFTVEEFLAQRDVNIEVGANDRLTPPRFTQLSDGMRITIVRVREETSCERLELPFSREIVQNEGLSPNEERLVQVGKNGIQEICYRNIIEDGVARERIPVGQATIIEAPINEVVIIGVEQNLEPINISGTLAYINNNNAWIIQGNSINKRPLTNNSDLDSLVFSLSPDGRYLLYTSKAESEEDRENFVNQLWVLPTTANAQAVQLVPTDVLHAEWLPNEEYTISYSTGQVQSIFPFWRALNNLWRMTFDPTSGRSLNVSKLVEENGGGLSGWWGTVYKWSPDGQQIAWARADSVGIINQNGELIPLLEYPFFRTTQNWSWRANLSWSPDSTLIATTTHGLPIGSEPPEASPVFNVTVTDTSDSFEGKVYDSAGIWSSPQFSPLINAPDRQFPVGYLAYLRAREPYNSVNGEYDLVVADRDGSNARAIFPPTNQAGITTSDFGLAPQNFTWNPDGTHIAVIYQGNLWMVDVLSGVANQLTFDGQSEHPVWTR